jgi:site-specific DNA recombinase
MMPSTNGHGSYAERVALYLRVSSEEQRDRETIEIQREFLEQYCQLYGLEVVDTYEDDGVSGTIPLHERPEGRRLLQDAKEGKFKAVLAKKLDRLGRTLLVIVDAHDRLQEAGIALRSATEPMDTSSPSGRLIFQMFASFAEYDRESIRERTQAGLHRAYRTGRHGGVIPYGYIADEHGHLKIVPEEAAMVRQIIENVPGGSTLYKEAKRLNDIGVPAPGRRYGSGKRRPGSSWSVMTTSNIVRQRAYSGIHEVKINGGADLIEREVPAIVERSLQERAKTALLEHKRYPDRRRDRKYLLSGLVKCEVCGFACTGHTARKRDKKRHYYVCQDGRGPHRAPYVSAPWLEQTVWSDVRRFIENPGEVLERVREEFEAGSEAEALSSRRHELEKKLAAKQAEKDRYVRLYAQEHISEEELETYLLDLKYQTDNIRLLLKSIEAELLQLSEQQEAAAAAASWLAALRGRLHEVEEDTEEAYRVRRQLVQLLVAGITAGRGEDGRPNIRITYRFGPPSADVGGSGEGDVSVDGVPHSVGYLSP